MKKASKKFGLHYQTLRLLVREDLEPVAGGFTKTRSGDDSITCPPQSGRPACRTGSVFICATGMG